MRRHRRGEQHPYGNTPQEVDSVYAVFFPVAGVLKIGFRQKGRHPISGTRQAFTRLGYADETPMIVFLQPGDFRAEAWIQAHLNYIWPWPRPAATRASEWYNVGGVPFDLMVDIIEQAYEAIPGGTL